MKNFLYFICLIVALCACQKEPQLNKSVEVSISVNGELETKLALSGFQFSFTRGDALSLIVEGVNDATISNLLTSNVNSFTGFFSHTTQDAENCAWYLVYPYDVRISSSGVITPTLPTSQSAPLDLSASVMYSNTMRQDYSETAIPQLAFSMNQALGIIKITIENNQSQYADDVIESIQLQSNSPLTGNYSIDVHDTSPHPAFDSYARTNAISVFDDDVPLGQDQAHTVYLFVNPTTLSGATITLTTNNHYFTLVSSSTINILQGDLTSLQTLYTSAFSVTNVVGTMKRVACWGDSYTCNNTASYADELQDLLGISWTVYNGGVSGDKIDEIAARQGGVGMVTDQEFTIPASGSVTTTGILRTKDDESRDGYFPMSRYGGNMANPCLIDGIECNVVLQNGSTTITRIETGEAHTVSAHTPIYSYGAREARDVNLQIIYMGTNGSPVYYGKLGDDNYYDNLVNYHKFMISYNDNASDYIVLGYHTGMWNEYYWTKFVSEFGQDRVIDLRHLIPQRGRELMVRTGAYPDLNSIPQSELDLIDNGRWPVCFRASSSDTHPSQYGARAMAIVIRERMQELGYLD